MKLQHIFRRSETHQIDEEKVIAREQFLAAFYDLKLLVDDPRGRLVVPQDDVNVKDPDVLETRL